MLAKVPSRGGDKPRKLEKVASGRTAPRSGRSSADERRVTQREKLAFADNALNFAAGRREQPDAAAALRTDGLALAVQTVQFVVGQVQRESRPKTAGLAEGQADAVRIQRVQTIARDDGERIEAHIVLEGRERRTERVFVESEGGAGLAPDANGFLLAAFIPAWVNGDRQILVDGTVCPRLAANIQVAATVLCSWFDDFPPLPRIEADFAYRAPALRAGAFLSGGVDSLAMVRVLADQLPVGCPDRPTAAVLLDYQEIHKVGRDETDARFAARKSICRAIASDLGLTSIALRTNLRRLNRSMQVWIYRHHGAFLAGMAHFLGGDYRMFHIASTYDVKHLGPNGSHPLLDPSFSSQHVTISHHGHEFSRLEKVGLIKDWPLALDSMNVCTSAASGGRNCGRCEKCIRTRLHLLLHGRLAAAGAFADDDVRPDEVDGLTIGTDYVCACYLDSIPGLRAIGRHDLAAAVERAVKKYRRRRSSALWRPYMALARRAKRLRPLATGTRPL